MTTTGIAAATIADLEKHPGRCELIDGEIIEMAPTGFEHGRSSSRVDRILGRWSEGRPFEVLTCDPGFIWNPQTVRAPDVAVITADQASRAPARGYMPFPPVAVVEVVSPGDEWSEVKGKVHGWLGFGVGMVWVVDPRTRSVEVHVPGQPVQELGIRDEIGGGAVLPGFACRVADFFA
jgi:Uma2 family endonuclease